jgi:polysaccharide export outer membrane protein
MRPHLCARLTHTRFTTLAAVPLLVTALLGGCAPGGDLPMLKDAPVTSYKLGPGDQVRVITFGDTDLSGEFRISDSGRIDLPLVGGFPAAGMTTPEVETEIADTLRQRKILNDPHVSLEVIAYRPVFVLGEVRTPGQFPYQPGMTVLTAVAVAGGFTYRAFEQYALVVRTADGHSTEGLAKPQEFVQPGDVIQIYERHF